MYAIMRMEKRKNPENIAKALLHNVREWYPKNANKAMFGQNHSWERMADGTWQATEASGLSPGEKVEGVMAYYHSRLPQKVRKNACHGIEILMTRSPGKFPDEANYHQACVNWAKKIFGEDNILSVAQHYDETTPHTHIIVMPMKDGKLNARHFIGGKRDRMRELQDDFYKEVGRQFGLERGLPREQTGAHHDRPSLEKGLKERIKALDKERETTAAERKKYEVYKSARETRGKSWEMPEAKFAESGQAYRKRVMPEVHGKIEEARGQAQRELATAAKRNLEAVKVKEAAQAAVEKYSQEAFEAQTREKAAKEQVKELSVNLAKTRDWKAVLAFSEGAVLRHYQESAQEKDTGLKAVYDAWRKGQQERQQQQTVQPQQKPQSRGMHR